MTGTQKHCFPVLVRGDPTNERGRSVSIVAVASARELVRLPTTRRLPSGIALSSDDRYAFGIVEGPRPEPGPVDIIDLGSLATLRQSTSARGQAASISVRSSRGTERQGVLHDAMGAGRTVSGARQRG